MAVGRVNVGGGIKKGQFLIKKIITDGLLPYRKYFNCFLDDPNGSSFIFTSDNHTWKYDIESEALIWEYKASHADFEYYDRKLKRFYMKNDYQKGSCKVVVLNNDGEKILEISTSFDSWSFKVVANENYIYIYGEDTNNSKYYIYKYTIDGEYLWNLALPNDIDGWLAIDKFDNVLFYSHNKLNLVKANSPEYIYQKTIGYNHTILLLDESNRVYTRDHDEGKINILNASNGSFIKTLSCPYGQSALEAQISVDNKKLFINLSGGCSCITSIETNELLQTLPWKCYYNNKYNVGFETKEHNFLLLFKGGDSKCYF